MSSIQSVASVQRITVLPQETIGTINPFLHGHFAEHLGELVYPGVWVGPDSAIPNTNGIRSDVVAALAPLGVPVLRWPGGCFADTYDWRDGIGPANQRPMRVNVHWGMAEEPNTFGTHEFMAFCRALGAEPYFAGNLGSGTPTNLRDWIEYCNFGGSSALADERRRNGEADPFHIRYWGVGNENWGCGGNSNAAEYAAAYSQFRTFVHDYPGSSVERIACGPNGGDWAWSEDFFETLGKGRMGGVQGFAAHYYCGTAGTATEYSDDEWLELLAKAAAVEGIITGHRAIMDRYDPQRKIKLILDEWGAWHPVEAGKPRGGLYQQNTIRDACVAALSLDIFHNHADKLFMANIAQLINVLQALLLVEEDRCIKTPTYHVFDLYRAHQNGRAVRLVSAGEEISDGGAGADAVRACCRDRQSRSLRVVQGSASVRENVLCVTAVNAHPTQPVDLHLDVRGANLGAMEVVLLAADDNHAHNTFAEPDRVTLGAPATIPGAGETLRVTLPAGSVVRILGPMG